MQKLSYILLTVLFSFLNITFWPFDKPYTHRNLWVSGMDQESKGKSVEIGDDNRVAELEMKLRKIYGKPVLGDANAPSSSQNPEPEILEEFDKKMEEIDGEANIQVNVKIHELLEKEWSPVIEGSLYWPKLLEKKLKMEKKRVNEVLNVLSIFSEDQQENIMNLFAHMIEVPNAAGQIYHWVVANGRQFPLRSILYHRMKNNNKSEDLARDQFFHLLVDKLPPKDPCYAFDDAFNIVGQIPPRLKRQKKLFVTSKPFRGMSIQNAGKLISNPLKYAERLLSPKDRSSSFSSANSRTELLRSLPSMDSIQSLETNEN